MDYVKIILAISIPISYDIGKIQRGNFMNHSENTLFETAPIPKAFFALTIPSVLGKIVMLLYNMADTWFIAASNDPHLVAGVSLVGPVFILMIALGDIFGIGGSSLIARMFGRNEYESAGRVNSFCFYTAITVGAAIGILLLIFQTPVLQMLGADEQTLPHAQDYYRYIILGMPFTVVSIVPLNILITEGMARESMIGSIVGSVMNIILDAVFIFGLNMGAAGAALATALGNVSSVALYIYFYRKAKYLSLSAKNCRVSLSDMKEIFYVGLPASLVNIMQGYSSALTNRFLLPYGNDKIAALGLSSKISMIANMVIVAFSYGAQSLIGYNYGQKNYFRLKNILKFAYTFLIGLSAAMLLILGLTAPISLGFFMDDPAIVSTGTQILRNQLSSMVFVAIILLSTCIFQATGKGKAALILCLCRQGIFFTIVMCTMNFLFGYTGVISAMPVSDLLAAVLAIILLSKNVLKEFP